MHHLCIVPFAPGSGRVCPLHRHLHHLANGRLPFQVSLNAETHKINQIDIIGNVGGETAIVEFTITVNLQFRSSQGDTGGCES